MITFYKVTTRERGAMMMCTQPVAVQAMEKPTSTYNEANGAVIYEDFFDSIRNAETFIKQSLKWRRGK